MEWLAFGNGLIMITENVRNADEADGVFDRHVQDQGDPFSLYSTKSHAFGYNATQRFSRDSWTWTCREVKTSIHLRQRASIDEV
ncbi:hypothetical protein Z517_09153 [Fonsecaea pedrosoi CBS 271.37]|uniref:Uncharacterized protein n=1 Tax=Fonsecaea pedrosoi CBS 271.37 TaxID=1442368 RepID=A0A0D2GWF9_9EURO|nr:uncharacterized protein Z517_09153 [Fonsecaea pedrosoi CBS 271.37]KIW76709.1 hypothetical protein Z517_09153 [Fonsecaea pedrosoi CBS 271.37]